MKQAMHKHRKRSVEWIFVRKLNLRGGFFLCVVVLNASSSVN